MKIFTVALAACVALHATAPAQSPTFNDFGPRGGQRGTEVTIEVTGSRLGGMQEPFLFRDGIEVLGVEQKGERGAGIRLRIAEDCPLGDHPIRLRTDRGITNMKLFSVGTQPEIKEVTPNDSLEQAQVIPLDVTVNGVLGAEDVDWFAVDLAADTRLTCEVQSNRLGINSDPKMALYDSGGELLALCDDTPRGRLDPIATLYGKQAGRYYIELSNGAPGYASSGHFRLHVGRFPRPVACLPAGGRPGEIVEVTLLGGGEPRTTEVKLTRDQRAHLLFPTNEYGAAPTPLVLAVRDVANVVEPQQEPREPLAFEAPAALNGILAAPGEIDRYRFTAVKGQRLDIIALARQLRSPVDIVLSVRQIRGSYRSSNDDAATRRLDSRIRFRAPEDGDYKIAVYDRLGRGGETFFYRVELAPPDRRTTTRISFTGRQDAEHVSIPAGGRMMTILSVQEGPRGSTPTLFDLPAGVSAYAGSVVPGTSLVPVVLEADAKTPLSGARASIGLQMPGQNSVLPAPFEHYCPLLRVRNNQVYDGRTMRSLPVAVTAPSPYSVEVLPPEVPLVQGSPLSLVVRIRRNEEFKGDVRIKMPWIPPGVSANEVTIKADQTEGRLALSARSNAPARTYKAAVYGYPTFRGGIMRASSQLFELTVATPWVTAQLGRTRTEQGAATELPAELALKKGFEGEARVRLLNLPRGVRTPPQKIKPDTTKISFPLTVAKNAPAGTHRGTVLRIDVPSPSGILVHYFRGGQLRIDEPLPTKPSPAKQ